MERLEREKKKKLSAERERALDDVMSATIIRFRDEMIREGKWRPSDATHRAEAEVERIQRDVFEGKGKLIDFTEACKRWKEAGS
jgi:hypothetical protein